ncbi:MULTISPECIES: DUF4253 domain-containing protein [Streptomyces]|uniref:DUF4253 domain-containing protein n=1 Tax=Streptomyces dengpaensis TaxID=2049881 RepID=A0ABM6SRN8_9ACTN|nr:MULTISPECIES: DUF4253 domain-containing protein [Streptomyces]AVH57247.1 DUF4253 domain-containing protein [Streptomyces dengpaensis]PIB03723.1 hypothetical protein B1C81_36090 [Streptomyces sp. HG99]
MATLPNPLPGLAADPSGRSLGLELPSGRLIDATYEGPWHEPLLWHADASAAPGGWAALEPARRTSGLLPLLIDIGGPQGGPEDWELTPGEVSYPGDHDAEEVLAEFWEDYAADELGADKDYPGKEKVVEIFGEPHPYEETVAPYGPAWPGLAPATERAADPDTRAAEIADSLADSGTWMKEPRLALVPARRSADIPAAIGWSGPVNYEGDVARLCAVLRSWEDRFGIRVVALTFDQLVLSVAAPPTTMAEAEAVAAEHFAFCPDNITQGDHETLRAYAAQEVLGKQAWSFWWD